MPATGRTAALTKDQISFSVNDQKRPFSSPNRVGFPYRNDCKRPQGDTQDSVLGVVSLTGKDQVFANG